MKHLLILLSLTFVTCQVDDTPQTVDECQQYVTATYDAKIDSVLQSLPIGKIDVTPYIKPLLKERIVKLRECNELKDK